MIDFTKAMTPVISGMLFWVAGTGAANAIVINADIVTIIDESGSMGGEQGWIGADMIPGLDSALNAAGAGDPVSAQYGLVGFGANFSHGTGGHQHDVGGSGSAFGSATEFTTATSSLVLSGSTEDGYDGIDFALSNYPLRANAATNIILVTDEDRDNFNSSLDYNSILAALNVENALLNAVVYSTFVCDTDGGGQSQALGIDSNGNGYIADGSGGFNVCSNGSAVSGRGTTIADYVDLALATGGAAWDLNQLRAGGLTAESFTAAFVDIKVGEIQQQQNPTIPEPTTLAIFGLGLAGLGFIRKQKT